MIKNKSFQFRFTIPFFVISVLGYVIQSNLIMYFLGALCVLQIFGGAVALLYKTQSMAINWMFNFYLPLEASYWIAYMLLAFYGVDIGSNFLLTVGLLALLMAGLNTIQNLVIFSARN